jgi:hypothetical protein
MSDEIQYALRPCASVGFAGYFHNDPLKGIVRGDLAWCLANPTFIDLYLSGAAGLTLRHKTPKWLPLSGALDAFCGAQLTGHISVNLKDFEISGSLQPWLRLSGVVAANLLTTPIAIEVAAVAYALYDPFSSHKLILVTGIGTGIGFSPPVNLRYFFSALGMEIKWTGELLLFFETLLSLSRGGNGEGVGHPSGIIRGRRR